MRKWFPDETTRDQIWNVLADTMQAADDDRGRGWAACAIHFSNHDRQPRLAVYCGVAQVLVVHSTRGVFLEVPPERIDAPAYASGVSTSQFPGTEVDEWGSRENLHPSVMIPAPYAMAAWQSGGQEAVVASIRWRSPEANDGQTAHWQFHCPALVDAVRRATGRPLRQPGYATSV